MILILKLRTMEEFQVATKNESHKQQRNKDLFARAFSFTFVVPHGGLSMVFQLEVCRSRGSDDPSLGASAWTFYFPFLRQSIKFNRKYNAAALWELRKKPTMPAFVIQLCHFLQPILYSVVWLWSSWFCNFTIILV